MVGEPSLKRVKDTTEIEKHRKDMETVIENLDKELERIKTKRTIINNIKDKNTK